MSYYHYFSSDEDALDSRKGTSGIAHSSDYVVHVLEMLPHEASNAAVQREPFVVVV